MCVYHISGRTLPHYSLTPLQEFAHFYLNRRQSEEEEEQVLGNSGRLNYFIQLYVRYPADLT